MLRPRRFLMELSQKVFHREEDFLAVAGTPVVLGHGLDEPRIQSKMAVHWHPPFSVMSAEVTAREKSRFRVWLSKVGVRRRSA